MRFPPSFLDEIRARLPVSEVVRRRVKLQKSGRELVGLSPFNQERTPSFFVNDQKMAWFDFSSGKNGNVFDFVMQTEGLSFPETVERLAQDVGLPLPARSPDSDKQDRQRAGLREVLEWAAAFFEQQLTARSGERARAYLAGRGLSPDSRALFRIGYAPTERHALRDHLAGKGATVDTMCEAGLLVSGADIAVPFDRFRDRVMFPIEDRSGRVIAFGGRALDKNVQAKYLNSPETPLFQKGRVLFNQARARKAAHSTGRVILVEGYMDVVAMAAAGFPDTVAPLGTALTEEQAGLLWSMAPQPILCFDGDGAGQRAAGRAAELALPFIAPTRTLAFALLPDKTDPDDLVRTEGPAAVDRLLASALPLVDLLWRRGLAGRTLTTPEQRAGFEGDLAQTVAVIRDETVRRHYRREIDQRLAALFGTSMIEQPAKRGGSVSGARPRSGRSGRARTAPAERAGYLSSPIQASPGLVQRLRGDEASVSPREALIMLLLIAHPSLIAAQAEALAALSFADSSIGHELQRMRNHLLAVDEDAPVATPALRRSLEDAGFASLIARIERRIDASSWVLRPETAPADAGFVLQQALTLHHRTRDLHNELISAQAALAADSSEINLARIRDLQEQIGAAAGFEAAIEGFGASSGRAASPV